MCEAANRALILWRNRIMLRWSLIDLPPNKAVGIPPYSTSLHERRSSLQEPAAALLEVKRKNNHLNFRLMPAFRYYTFVNLGIANFSPSSKTRLVLRTQIPRLPEPIPPSSTKPMQGNSYRQHSACNGSLGAKSLDKALAFDPVCNEERVDEGAEVQKDGIEGDYGHAVHRIAVDDIRGEAGVSHLNAGCKEEQGDLADNEVHILLDGD